MAKPLSTFTCSSSCDPAVEFTEAMISRAQGCLIGQFVGDALGSRYVFKDTKVVRIQMAKGRKSHRGFLPILGGSHFTLGDVPITLKPGQVTAGTELAMALAATLLGKSKYDQTAVACAYRHWLDSDPFEVKFTLQEAFTVPASLQEPEGVHDRILKQSKEMNMGTLSNVCLTRISPLAIAGTTWSHEELANYSKLDAQFTDPDLNVQVAAASYTVAISELIRSGDATKAFLAATKVTEESALVTRFLQNAEKNCDIVLMGNGTIADSDLRNMRYFGVAFQWAFIEMLHAKSLVDGLERVISRGGETDTNGCICGALLGAKFGVEAIPEKWRTTVTECKQCREDVYPWVTSANLPRIAINLLKLNSSK